MRILLFVLALLPLYAGAQIINTIAGNGSPTASGDNGQATAAGIGTCGGIAIDAAGNLYVASWSDHTIRKVAPSGVITRFAGNSTPGFGGDGGAATDAQLNNPNKITIDNTGNMYIADYTNNRVRKVTSAGFISTIAGNGTPGYSLDGIPATNSELNHPSGVAVDATGNVYIADYANYRVRKVSTSGIISTIAGTGTPGNIGDGGLATAAEIDDTYGLALDAANNLYLADAGNNKIRKISASGIMSTYAGTGVPSFSGDGFQATDATLNNPAGVAVDHANNVYVGDQFNNRIRKIAPSGVISTVVGDGTMAFYGDNGPATAAEINYSNEVTFDAASNLILDDNGNNRIRRVSACINSITVQPANDTVPVGASAVYTVTTSALSPVYQWQEDPGTGFVNLANVWPYSGVTTSSLTIHNASIYLNTTHYRCVINNGTPCVDTSSSAILIIHSNTGLRVLGLESISIFPNPSHDEIYVRLADFSSPTSIELYNELGQFLITKKIDNALTKIDIASLPTGIYIIKAQSEGDIVYRKCFKN
jgi:type IX secretion system substrate protein/NHL repeat-containing protein